MSYDKKQTFSMIAGRTRNHPEHLYSVENVELLKVSAIYGANASGKSKLVEAMRFACHVINNEIPVSASNQFCKLTAENKHKPSTFDFEFCVNGMFYAYGFSAILSQHTVVASGFTDCIQIKTNRIAFMRGKKMSQVHIVCI